MRSSFSVLLATVLFFIFPLSLAAQSRNVSLVIKDASNGEPVPYATVSLTKSGAKTPSKYILSDADGRAVIEKVAQGKYLMKVELLGYKEFTRDIEVRSAVDLGEVKLEPDTKVLDAASVSATGNPIIVKKDTVEYNASSFKTTDNDMLVDLLKKMPGMEVSEDGSITFNGKSINKITIDGKTFFLDDPQLATKNIPSKIVNKLKVINKKSEQAEFTGIDDGDEETVIDLSIRPGMMNGLFGNVMAGGGHDLPEKSNSTVVANGSGDYRYQGAAFLGRFTEKNQISVILNGNNTNNRGFNDVAGNMMQGMRSGGMGRGQGGWGNGNGISSYWMGGVNANTMLFDDKMKLEGNYLYNQSRNDVQEIGSKTTFLEDYNLIYNNKGYSTTNSNGNRFGARIEHKFSENSSLIFQPQFNFGKSDFNQYSDFQTQRQDAENLFTTNEGINRNIGNGDSKSANGFLLLRQRLGKPGRTISLFARYNFSNSFLDGLNQSLTSTYDEFDVKSDSIVNQRYAQNNNSASLSGRLAYTEPLGGNFFAEANYMLGWSRNNSVKNTFDSGDNSGFNLMNQPYIYLNESFNNTFSNSILNEYINQSIGGNLVYQKDKLRGQVGMSVNPTKTHNVTNGRSYDSNVLNWAPQARLWYEINDNANVRLFYFGRSDQPSISQLMPVPDNSNPLNIRFGNPYLKPYFNHNLRSEFRFTNKQTFFTVNANLEGSLVQDQIVSATWYDKSGAQYSIPVNGKSSKNVSGSLFLNVPIAKSKFSVFSMTRASYSASSSFISSNFTDTDKYYKDGVFDYELFHNDIPDLNADSRFSLNDIQSLFAFQRLRFTYRSDNLELTLGGRTRVSKSWYTVANSSVNATFNNQIDASVNWTLPFGLGFDTDFDYNWYNGYKTKQDDEFVLNAEISQLLFKKTMTLSLKVYDLFNQAKNLSVSDSANYHSETWNNTLGRYVMLSLTWRFGNFKNNNFGGRGTRPPYGRP